VEGLHDAICACPNDGTDPDCNGNGLFDSAAVLAPAGAAAMTPTEPDRKNDIPDFGQQLSGYEDPHPWVVPLLGALCWLAFCAMLLTGTAPWQ